jgi:DNA-binding SARP family transcriptional activator
MPSLHVYLFGPLRVGSTAGDDAVEPPPQVSALLGYLLLHPGPHTRSQLAEALWPDLAEDRARRCLSTALWRLRQAVEPGDDRGTRLLTGANGDVRLRLGTGDWIDVLTFQRSIDDLLNRPVETLRDSDLRHWRATLSLHAGALLLGMDDEWVQADRERLRQLHVDALVGLARAHSYRGEHAEAIALARDALRAEPLREDVHRDLIAIYLEAGQRASALRQYESCRATLEAELGTRPSPSTQDLYRRVREDQGTRPATLRPTSGKAALLAVPRPPQDSRDRRDPVGVDAEVDEVVRRLAQVASALIGCGELLRASIAKVPEPRDAPESAG